MSTIQTHHGELPARIAAQLTCPATEAADVPIHGPGRHVEAQPGTGYRAKFRCLVCRFEFTVSDAQLRRLDKPAESAVEGGPALTAFAEDYAAIRERGDGQ